MTSKMPEKPYFTRVYGTSSKQQFNMYAPVAQLDRASASGATGLTSPHPRPKP